MVNGVMHPIDEIETVALFPQLFDGKKNDAGEIERRSADYDDKNEKYEEKQAEPSVDSSRKGRLSIEKRLT
jgi:hypothetical protein